MSSQSYSGHILDVVNRTVIDGTIIIEDGMIKDIETGITVKDAPYIIPGFVDSHVHIESSMMMPSRFAGIARRHGTVAAVCDPHEIANVLGIAGIELMLDDARTADFHFGFCAPSCVPSCGTDIETSGAVLDSKDISSLMQREDIIALAEMMNYPGVLMGDPDVMAKIAAAKANGKPVDGHAPGLRGDERRKYADAGISTDHECTDPEEASEAIRCGMDILIREGSAAKNFDALCPLIAEYPEHLMFCTDDSHPTDLVTAHIDKMVRRAMASGYNLMDILRIACVNPVLHYKLPVGLLQKGDPADFIILSDTTPDFKVLATVIHGRCHDSGKDNEEPDRTCIVEDWMKVCKAAPVCKDDIEFKHPSEQIHQIIARDKSLLTGHFYGPLDSESQKIVVYNRYSDGAKPKVGYIRGFGLKNGAFAQTIAHDCHNIIAIGSDDTMLADVINRVIGMGGGIAATDGNESVGLGLPIAGLLSPLDGEVLAAKNRELEKVVRNAGCRMTSPFITLGFMALPVIPELKMTDMGLFDATTWSMDSSY